MKNLIIKKDIKNNYLMYILSTLVVIVLTIVLSHIYSIFKGDMPEIYAFISALSVLLIPLLAFILTKNVLGDEHSGLVRKVKSIRKYLYYRVFYTLILLLYFLIIGISTYVITTSSTWEMVSGAIDIPLIMLVCMVGLLYLSLLIIVLFKTLYNFKIPAGVLVLSILYFVSMVFALVFAIQFDNVTLILNIGISICILVVLLELIIASFGNYNIAYAVVTGIIIAIIVFMTFFFSFAYAYEEVADYSPGGDNYTLEDSTDEYTSSYEIYYQDDTTLITQTDNINYTIYIDGETYETVAHFSEAYVEMGLDMTMVNFKTGEQIAIYGDSMEGYGSVDIQVDTVNGYNLDTCEEFFEDPQNINISDIIVTLDQSQCLDESNYNELKFVLDQIDSLLPTGNISPNNKIED